MYGILCNAFNKAGGRISTKTTFTVVPLPQNLTASTDKSTYLLGETVNFTLSAENATKYTISLWDGGEFGKGNCVLSTPYFSPGVYTYTPSAAGTYGIGYQAENDAGKYITTHGTFTVITAPVITTQPKNYVGTIGSTATATVVATGTGLTYQWYFANPGATSFTKSGSKTATYSATLTAANSGRRMFCEITDSKGNSIVTNIVTMKVG
jgi:hypothetical protein